MVDRIRRRLLKTGAAATVMAAAPQVFAQRGSFYEKGASRIHYEEAGSGFPLLVIPGGGLNSTIAALKLGRPRRVPSDVRGPHDSLHAADVDGDARGGDADDASDADLAHAQLL